MVACASFGVSAGDGVVLTPGRTEVLIAPDAPKTVQFAAIDLTNHLARIFGAEVPLVTAPREGFTQVVLGDSAWTRAAGLDVWADEPTHNQALIDHPNVSCTPHIGAATVEAQKRIGAEIVRIIGEL